MVAKTRTAQKNGMVDARKVMDQYVFGTSNFMEIPVANIKVDVTYQREQAESLLTRIVSHFDFNKFEPPTVNVRPNGDCYAVDGGHRVEAARRLGMETITCRIIHVDPSEEPAFFIDMNRARRWVTPVQTFKAEVRNGNPSAIEIQRCLEEHGLRVASTRSPQTMSCTGTLHKIYAKRGTVGLNRIVDVVLGWPDDEPRRFAGQLLQGIDAFYDMQPNVDDVRLKARLSTISTGLLLSRASTRWHAWRAVDQRGGSVIDATAEEIKKQYAKAS